MKREREARVFGMRVASLGVIGCVVAGCMAAPEPDGEVDASFRSGDDFEAAYVGCDEFAGVGVVPIANVLHLVPDDYVVIEPFPGAAIVVAQSGSCDEISVDGAWAEPGVFAQFGVGVVPPLTPGNGDFYQLFFTTTHAKLASKLKKLGVEAKHSNQLSYEISAEPELAIDVPKPNKLAFSLDGPITLPDPLAPSTSAVFNYYAQSKQGSNVLQQNSVEGIRLGEGSGVVLTAIGKDMEDIVGGEFLVFPFFSSPEIFDQAAVSVQADAF